MGIYGLPLLGLIPARAGTTCYEYLRWRSSRAHPRSRGEHFSKLTHCNFHVGSSPLARGTPCWWARLGRRLGLIPARAGNTGIGSFASGWPWAHPRSRGEHRARSHASSARRGSSPLARGTPGQATAYTGDTRLIPARAGNTCGVARLWCNWWAHPRSRGEHDVMTINEYDKLGSSPLARGTRGGSAVSDGRLGLIPARAGNTT